LDPILQIGQQEGDESVQFFGVTGGIRLPDGRIAVLNSGSSTIRIFDPQGRLLHEFGGAGDGPGEFRSLSSVHLLHGDTVLIWDSRRPGYSIFTSSGAHLGSQALRPPGTQQLQSLSPLPDGRLLLRTYASPLTQDPVRSEGIHRDSAPLLIFNRQGTVVDTVGVFPSQETAIIQMAGRSGVGMVPFGRSCWTDVRGHSIILGIADDLAVSVLNLEGGVEEIYRIPGVDLALREEDRDWFAERLSERASSPEERQMVGVVMASLPFPQRKAAYNGMTVDGDGNIWLRTGRHFPPEAPSPEWTVISNEGVLLGTLSLPPALEPLQIGSDFILGVWKDELGVEYIRLYGLDKPSS